MIFTRIATRQGIVGVGHDRGVERIFSGQVGIVDDKPNADNKERLHKAGNGHDIIIRGRQAEGNIRLAGEEEGNDNASFFRRENAARDNMAYTSAVA